MEERAEKTEIGRDFLKWSVDKRQREARGMYRAGMDI